MKIIAREMKIEKVFTKRKFVNCDCQAKLSPPVCLQICGVIICLHSVSEKFLI